jgi:hypothetical protein
MHGARVGAALAIVAFAVACQTPVATTPPLGLGELMSFIQMRHIKLWLAGEAGNWPLASYEIDELEEGFGDVVRFHPTHEGSPRPLSELVPELTGPPIHDLRAAVARRDAAAFTTAYDSLTAACNGCHDAAGFPINVLIRPTGNPYTDQRFRPAP